MVGSMKLAKINYRLQDLVEGRRKQDFMGGISFLASGKLKFIIKVNISSINYLILICLITQFLFSFYCHNQYLYIFRRSLAVASNL
jgi:hypothetical protein